MCSNETAVGTNSSRLSRASQVEVIVIIIKSYTKNVSNVYKCLLFKQDDCFLEQYAIYIFYPLLTKFNLTE